MIVGERGRAKKTRRFALVLGDAAAFLVERRQRVLGFRIAGLRGGAEQFGGARECPAEIAGLRDRAARDRRLRRHGRALRLPRADVPPRCGRAIRRDRRC